MKLELQLFAEIILTETASVAAPSASKVSLFADNTANPQMKFTDDNGNTRTIVDNNNTVTLANKTYQGVSVAVTGAITSNGTAGIGYATGAGGLVTQATSKATAFTLSKVTGTITFASDALASQTTVSATWTNTTIGATDLIVFTQISGGTLGAYEIACTCASGKATIYLRNTSAESLSEAPVFRYAIIKSVTG